MHDFILKKVRIFYQASVLCFLPLLGLAEEPFSFDVSFGEKGIVTTSVSAFRDQGEMVVVRPDGKIFVAGVADVKGKADWFLLSYHDNGTLDTSFGKNGIVRLDLGGQEGLFGMVLDSQNRIILGGFSEINQKRDTALARLKPDGTLDESFGEKGIVSFDWGAQDEIHYLALQQDGKIVAAGFRTFSHEKNLDSDGVVARYLENGTLDNSYGQNGLVIIEHNDMKLYGLALDIEGRVVVTGSWGNPGFDDCVIVRLTIQGSLDPTFGLEGIQKIIGGPKQDTCSSVIVLPDQSIMVGGYFISNREKSDSDWFVSFYRNNPTTNPLPFFREFEWDQEEDVDLIHALGVLPSGTPTVAGEARQGNQSHFAVVKIEKTKQNLQLLETVGLQDAIPNSLFVDTQGRVVITGLIGKKIGTVRLFSGRSQ